MAKATLTCTCKKCGQQFCVTRFFSNRSDADHFVEFYTGSDHYDTCQDCYAEEMKVIHEKEIACQKIAFETRIELIDKVNLECVFYPSVSNTYAIKDQLKELGYKWNPQKQHLEKRVSFLPSEWSHVCHVTRTEILNELKTAFGSDRVYGTSRGKDTVKYVKICKQNRIEAGLDV